MLSAEVGFTRVYFKCQMESETITAILRDALLPEEALHPRTSLDISSETGGVGWLKV